MLSAFTTSMATYFASYIGLLLLASAAHKLIDPQRASAASGSLLGLSGSGASMAWMSAATLETGAAAAILFSQTRLIGAIIAALLWATYSAAILAASRRGDDIDCGCSFGGRRDHSTTSSFRRSSTLFLCAAALAVMHTVVPPVSIGAVEILGGLAFLVLHMALDLTYPLVPRIATK